MKPKLLAALLAITMMLPGCYTQQVYYYKLTLTVDTPDGIKSAFNVVKVRAHAGALFGMSGFSGGGSTVTGEALYLDLGPNKRPLIALLSAVPADRVDRSLYPGRRGRWEEDHPSRLLLQLYGDDYRHGEDKPVDGIKRLAKYRGKQPLPAVDLPELITFADINDPLSVMAVDEKNPSLALQQNVTWRSLTLEVTDEPMTTGILKKLPWLAGIGILSGHTTSDVSDKNLARGLTSLNFKRN
jgi:hypothetical protein